MATAPPIPITSLTSDELLAAAKIRVGGGAGKARDIYRLIVQEGVFDPARAGLGTRAVEAFRGAFSFALPEVVRVVSEPSDLGATAKMVLRLADGYEVESVRIPMGRDRYTLCVSTQVGCKMGCQFCETARMGLLRHLTTEEIVAQLLVARHRLGWSIRNIVFMGMGEALDNFDHLAQTLRVLTDPGSFSIGQERLTVCTVGHVDGIQKLAALGMKRLNLSVSLNAANDPLRSAIMPVNRTKPLAVLQQALASYRPRKNFVLGVNYCLLPGMNDRREDAQKIAEFCRPLGRALVNVIPYNPGNAPLTRAPTEEEIVRFIGWLRDEGLPVRRRITKGRDVMAACGQLGNVELRATIGRRSLRTIAPPTAPTRPPSPADS